MGIFDFINITLKWEIVGLFHKIIDMCCLWVEIEKYDDDIDKSQIIYNMMMILIKDKLYIWLDNRIGSAFEFRHNKLSLHNDSIYKHSTANSHFVT